LHNGKSLLIEVLANNQQGEIGKYYEFLKNNPQTVNYYRQGRSFEYACMKKGRSLGFYTFRKFGSKGFEDVVWIKGSRVYFIQCKHSKYHDTTPEKTITPEYQKGLIDLAARYGVKAVFCGVRNHRMYFQIYEFGEWRDFTPTAEVQR
jgi:hypothetical protein